MGQGVLGAWSNGKAGRYTARRIWLRPTADGYEVEARQGDSDQPSRFWDLPTEKQARELVKHLQRPNPDADDPNDGWRDITSLYERQP